MTWELFYLICFLLGLVMSALSLLGGMGHFGAHVHLPHAGHLPHTGHIAHGGTEIAGRSSTASWWNAFTLMIFLCWFGAAGYLLTRHSSLVVLVVLTISVACGVIGGAIVFWFLVKVMMPHDRELTADQTSVVGAVGRISAPIRAGGTGELLYEQMGALRSAPARAEDNETIGKQEEVFVVRYEKGIAYVRRWDDGMGGSE